MEAGTRRGSGSAGNHYRVECGGKHFRGPGWNSLEEREKHQTKEVRRLKVKKEKKVIRVESEETQDYVSEAKSTEQEEMEERIFVPSVPQKPLFRCDNQCSEKTLSCWQLASVVVAEGDEACTTTVCQKCFSEHLQARGEKPLSNVQLRQVVEKNVKKPSGKMKAPEWASDRIKEAFDLVAQDEAEKVSIVQEIMLRSTDHLRRIIAPVGGQGGVTASFLCPNCNSFLLEDCVWWVSRGNIHKLVVRDLWRKVRLEATEQPFGRANWRQF